jgi:hypothetical protein
MGVSLAPATVATEVLGLGEKFVKVQVYRLWMSEVWGGEETRDG